MKKLMMIALLACSMPVMAQTDVTAEKLKQLQQEAQQKAQAAQQAAEEANRAAQEAAAAAAKLAAEAQAKADAVKAQAAAAQAQADAIKAQAAKAQAEADAVSGKSTAVEAPAPAKQPSVAPATTEAPKQEAAAPRQQTVAPAAQPKHEANTEEWQSPEEQAASNDKEWQSPEAEKRSRDTWDDSYDFAKNSSVYLSSTAVPVVDGKVTWVCNLPNTGKSAGELRKRVEQFFSQLADQHAVKSVNELPSSDGSEVRSVIELLTFNSSFLALDQTQLTYTLEAKIANGGVRLTMSNLNYTYKVNSKTERYRAENWIVDKYAVNKKHTRLFPISGKFRRKTIDRKNELFKQFKDIIM